jgi:glucose/arabinose dehydrogenase
MISAVPAAKFDQMLGLVPVPGSEDEAVVLTQPGQIWRVSLTEATEPVLYADLSGRIIPDFSYEEGLLGLAFSPDFETDARVFVHYTAGPPRRNVLSSFTAMGASLDLASEQAILEVEQPFPNHNGGQLAFGPDGYLYVALGDGGAGGDPFENGQNLGTLLGKILRIDVSAATGYTIPPDNPFVDTAGALPEIYAYGFRNPWRFTFDSETGDLWAGDVGQNSWEEADRVVGGGNYGWNVMEGFECFDAGTCDQEGLVPPRAVYPNTAAVGDCAIIGGYVYRGSAMPELVGWYIYADFCSGKVWAANSADDSPPVLIADTELPISSFAELPDGEIVAKTYARGISQLVRDE